MLKILVKNHEQVARQHSSLAGLVHRVAPEYLRRRVEADFARELRQHLLSHGIQAEVVVEPDPPA